MKFIVALLLLVSLGLASDACVVKSNLSEGQDTMFIVKVSGSTSASLTCITPAQLRTFMVADTGYPACMASLKVKQEVNDLLIKRNNYADSAFFYASTSTKVCFQAVDTLTKVLGYASKIDSNSIKIRELTEDKLKRCEDSKPSLMMQAATHLGAVTLGFLAALLLVVAVK